MHGITTLNFYVAVVNVPCPFIGSRNQVRTGSNPPTAQPNRQHGNSCRPDAVCLSCLKKYLDLYQEL